MDRISTVKDIIALWPSRAELVLDMASEAEPVSLAQVNKWAQRGSIPAAFHAGLLRGAQRRGLGLTAADVVGAHDRAGLDLRAEDAA